METAREFRLKLKSASSVGGKKGQAAVPAAKPTHATVFVAKTYPPWQCTVLSVLKQFYESGNGGDNKAISQALGAKPEIKKWAKKTMPFVQFVKARIEEFGLAALDLTLDFDEAEVLLDNLDYLTSTLQMEGVDVKFASEANEKIQEECRPGTPFILFRTDPSVDLTLINNQPHSGLFHVICPIMDGDNLEKIARRIFRTERNVKDAKKVSLFRHEDPILGPRRIPVLDKPLDGKIEISAEQIFRIDLEKKQVFLESNGGKIELGDNIIFRV